MKYFTRDRYNAMQGNPALKRVKEADTQWEAARRRYERHCKKIMPALSESVRKFAAVSFHDGIVTSFAMAKNSLTIGIDGYGCWGPGGKLELIFSGVKSVRGLDGIINDWWLFEEVHRSKTAHFAYHVLLARSELVVAAEEARFKIKKK